MPLAQQDLSKLLHALYGAVAEPAAWQAMVPLVAQAFGGSSSVIGGGFRGIGAQGSLHFLAFPHEHYPPELAQDYLDHWQYQDPLVSAASRGPPGAVFGSHELIDEAQFLRTAYYNEYYRHLNGIFYSQACVVMPLNPQGDFGNIVIGRPRSAGAFGPEQKRDLSLFIPHLQQALRLWAGFTRLRAERDASLGALDALRIGIIVVDAAGALAFANPVAESLLRSRSELSVRHGRLRLHDPVRDQALHRAIRDAAATAIGRGSSIGGVFAVPRTGARPLSLRVCPMPEHLIRDQPYQPSALVFLSDPDWQPQSLCEMLGILYGLTPTEARLAEALANGEALVDYAARVRISMNTANTHLRQVFSKTGQRRQSQLIQEILSNPLTRMSLPQDA